MNRTDEESVFYFLLANPIQIQNEEALRDFWKGFCVGIELLTFQLAGPIAALGSRSERWRAHAGCFE